MKTISDQYRSLNREHHERDGTVYGAHGHVFADPIFEIITKNNVASILDYGCGKGTLKAALKERGFKGRVFEYDPAIPGKLKCPDEADMVTCTDVLEHIEPEFLDTVLAHIAKVAKRFAYVSIHHFAARKTLQDGRNAHLIQESPEWWLKKLEERFIMSAGQTVGESDGTPVQSMILLVPRR